MTCCPKCGHEWVELGPALLPPDLGFETWWAKYPRKVAKLDAAKAYAKAVRQGLATPAQLLEGLTRYCLYKPEDQPWCHPATWLNGGRWMDQEPEFVHERRREARREADEPVAIGELTKRIVRR